MWSYSGVPGASDLDKYRFLIGDTTSSDPILQDEEITFVLSENTNHNIILFRLFEAVTVLFARDYKKKLGPQEEDPTSRLDFYRTKLEYYRRLVSGLGSSGLSLPVYASYKCFTKGMHDNV